MLVLIIQYIMIKKSAVISALCLLLCMSFNSTFPLRNPTSPTTNGSSKVVTRTSNSIVERTKKMASNIENALKRIKDSTQGIGRKLFTGNSSLVEEDLRQYEQLVIMKKYPFLDIKELLQKYSPSMKNTRQSYRYVPSQDYKVDTSFYEPAEEGLPSVEIINRGLSGFSIPSIKKHFGIVEDQKKEKNCRRNNPLTNIVDRDISEQRTKSELHNDIVEFGEVLVNRNK